MDARLLLLGLVGYLLAGYAILGAPARWREMAFLALNLAAATVLFQISKPVVLIYVALVSLHYALLRKFRDSALPLAAPIIVLIAARALPAKLMGPFPAQVSLSALFVGLSYMAFRLTWAAVEVRNGIVALPSYLRYMNFAFFAPTLFIGPIHRLSAASLPRRKNLPSGLLRVLVGAGKYVFLANVVYRLTFAGVFNNPQVSHSYADLALACVGFHLYLFFNFSGFCDIAVGIGQALGIQISENFDTPLLARNISDYWNRWHITLSHFLRELIFTPLCMTLIRTLGPAQMNAVVSVAAIVTFCLSGIWHGSGLNFLWWGLANGIGVAVHHLYAETLKKVLKKNFIHYERSKWIRVLATALTFAFVSGSMLFVANDWAKLKDLLNGF